MCEKAKNVLRRIIAIETIVNDKEKWSIEECRDALAELELGGCKHSMNDLMAKAGIVNPCPVCMQNIIDRQAEQLTHYKKLASEALGGAVSDFDLLLASERTARSDICELKRQLAIQDKEIERLKIGLTSIQSWANAYPLDVFPKPDLKKAAEALKANGMTLDAINADAVRGALDGIKGIVEQALKGGE